MSVSKKLFSRKELLKLIFPFMVELALTLLVGIIDSVMVSSVGEAAVSGVSLVDTVFQLLIYIFAAFGTGGANGIENGLFQAGKIILASLVASYGISAITANAICQTVASIQVIPGSAMNFPQPQ